MIPYDRLAWVKLLLLARQPGARGYFASGGLRHPGALSGSVRPPSRRFRCGHPSGFHEIAGDRPRPGVSTNTAYARFWEGRQLWGGIVNSTRRASRGSSPRTRLWTKPTRACCSIGWWFSRTRRTASCAAARRCPRPPPYCRRAITNNCWPHRMPPFFHEQVCAADCRPGRPARSNPLRSRRAGIERAGQFNRRLRTHSPHANAVGLCVTDRADGLYYYIWRRFPRTLRPARLAHADRHRRRVVSGSDDRDDRQ